MAAKFPKKPEQKKSKSGAKKQTAKSGGKKR